MVIVLGLARIEGSGLISLWCAWAAVSSILIVLHLLSGDQERDSVPAASEAGES